MIQVVQVNKRFGPVLALDQVTLSIAAGERVAFVGANGSGKTTLLRAMLGLVRFEGKITVGGSDVAREPELALRSVAYIPQIAPPIDAPVAEVIRAHAALRGMAEEETWTWSERLGLPPAAARAKRFRDLSGGMKQKLLAAMALATKAPVLVCDEPTANLDGEARAAFLLALADRPRGSVVVLCSHRIEEVRQLVDRVVELRDGRVARDVGLAEVIEDLHAFRVEVALSAGAEDAAAFLKARGFAPSGPGRLAARVPQREKLELVTRLLKEHGDAITDLSVVPAEDVSVDAPRGASGSRPQLKVVGR